MKRDYEESMVQKLLPFCIQLTKVVFFKLERFIMLTVLYVGSPFMVYYPCSVPEE